MELFNDPLLIWLLLTSIPIGVFAILIGGSMFLSIPVFQILFPGMAMASIIGNIKMGSALRNISAVFVLRKHVNAREFIPLILIFCLGSMIGAYLIASASNLLLLPTLVAAVLVTEFAPWLSAHIPKSLFYLIAFAVGIFGGMIGAGLMFLIVALLRIAIPEDHNIHHVRSLAVFTELLMALSTIVVLWFAGNLILQVWVVWAAGSLIGGYIGGILLHRTGKLSPRVQRWALRAVFVFALVIATLKIIYP